MGTSPQAWVFIGLAASCAFSFRVRGKPEFALPASTAADARASATDRRTQDGDDGSH